MPHFFTIKITMMNTCLSKNCFSVPAGDNKFCNTCLSALSRSDAPAPSPRPDVSAMARDAIRNLHDSLPPNAPDEMRIGRRHTDRERTMSEKYPQYYKPVPKKLTELDVYATCMMFGINDPSGAVHHAIKKLLLPGVRTGKKTRWDDIKEARDTLNRWLELNDPT